MPLTEYCFLKQLVFLCKKRKSNGYSISKVWNLWSQVDCFRIGEQSWLVWNEKYSKRTISPRGSLFLTHVVELKCVA